MAVREYRKRKKSVYILFYVINCSSAAVLLELQENGKLTRNNIHNSSWASNIGIFMHERINVCTDYDTTSGQTHVYVTF